MVPGALTRDGGEINVWAWYEVLVGLERGGGGGMGGEEREWEGYVNTT